MQNSYYVYNFPEIRQTEGKRYFALLEQAKKIQEEASEVVDARLKLATHKESMELRENLLIETLDTVQACETMLRLFELPEISHAKELVIEKNAERGYYV